MRKLLIDVFIITWGRRGERRISNNNRKLNLCRTSEKPKRKHVAAPGSGVGRH